MIRASVYYISEVAEGNLDTQLFSTEQEMHGALATRWLNYLETPGYEDICTILAHAVQAKAKLPDPEDIYARMQPVLKGAVFSWGERVLEPKFALPGTEVPNVAYEFVTTVRDISRTYLGRVMELLQQQGWTITRDRTRYACYLPNSGCFTISEGGYEIDITFSPTGKTIQGRSQTVPQFKVGAQTARMLSRKIRQKLTGNILPKAAIRTAAAWLDSQQMSPEAQAQAIRELRAAWEPLTNKDVAPLKSAVLTYAHEPTPAHAQVLLSNLISTGHFQAYAAQAGR